MQDLLNYEGKTCVVTGAASGIGEATAKLLVDLGAKVYALDIKEPSLLVKQYINVNLGNKESIDLAVSQLPQKIDRVFNCAGIAGTIYSGRTFSQLDVATINFIGPRYLIESLIPRMQEGNSIAVVASLAGRNWQTKKDILLPFITTSSFEEAQRWFVEHEYVEGVITGKETENPPYRLSKEAAITWVKHRAWSLSEKKIRINAISPSHTETPMAKDFNEITKKNVTGGFVSKVGRGATPQDQAKALIFLNSDLASFVSGQDLQVDYSVMSKLIFSLD
jgi:NAD(P)-dependent dehydrogenase (short-subunit alcohol dehydrogenase family)